MKYIIPLHEYNTESSMQTMYHGTALSNLRSILKNGLLPSTKKVYDFGYYMKPSFFQRSIESVGGIYLTKSISDAIYASNSANAKYHSNDDDYALIIICTIQKKTLKLDEDELPETIDEIPSLKYVNVFDPIPIEIENLYHLYKATINPNDNIENINIINTYRNAYIKKNIFRIEEEYETLNNNLKTRLSKIFYNGFDLVLQRLASHLSMALTKERIEQDGVSLPDIDIAEHNYTKYLGILTTTMKSILHRNDDMFENGRIEEPITFRGTNKIISIVSVSEENKNIIVYYGTLPKEFLMFCQKNLHTTNIQYKQSTFTTNTITNGIEFSKI